jgi:hypothetical protein
MARIEPAVDELLRASPFPEADKLELAAMHEEILGMRGPRRVFAGCPIHRAAPGPMSGFHSRDE